MIADNGSTPPTRIHQFITGRSSSGILCGNWFLIWFALQPWIIYPVPAMQQCFQKEKFQFSMSPLPRHYKFSSPAAAGSLQFAGKHDKDLCSWSAIFLFSPLHRLLLALILPGRCRIISCNAEYVCINSSAVHTTRQSEFLVDVITETSRREL